MHIYRTITSAFLSAVIFSSSAAAQTKVASPVPAPTPITATQDFSDTQAELIRLLRLSPTLTTVVARDPSLLASHDYVARNNPQLSQFLDTHPEITRNPDFYLFTRDNRHPNRHDQALERAVWPEFTQARAEPLSVQYIREIGPAILFLVFIGILFWLIRILLENRRWNRIFKLQAEVHARLIDKFGSNEELLSYMSSDVGKRFLEAGPISVNFEQEQLLPNALTRILTPLQIGIVLTLLGKGFFFLRHSLAGMEAPMLVLGTLALMPGLGFILSAAITWFIAYRLGLMPNQAPRP